MNEEESARTSPGPSDSRATQSVLRRASGACNSPPPPLRPPLLITCVQLASNLRSRWSTLRRALAPVFPANNVCSRQGTHLVIRQSVPMLPGDLKLVSALVRVHELLGWNARLAPDRAARRGLGSMCASGRWSWTVPAISGTSSTELWLSCLYVRVSPGWGSRTRRRLENSLASHAEEPRGTRCSGGRLRVR